MDKKKIGGQPPGKGAPPAKPVEKHFGQKNTRNSPGGGKK
jgi:hypothetical protein